MSRRVDAAAEFIRKRIVDGRYARDVPAQASLAVQMGETRSIVASALRVVADQGLIYHNSKRGSYIVTNPFRRTDV